MEPAPTPLLPHTPRAREEQMEATLQQLKGYFANEVSKDPRVKKWIDRITKALEK